MKSKKDKSIYKPIGNYIRLVDNRNKNLSVTNLLGINITKDFMPSVANVSGTDLSKYKIIEKGQFAANIMHVGRDERLPVGLYNKNEPAIISPAYVIFEIINTNELLPEYLMIEFFRGEFDRYTWFICDSSIRGGLDWERFCEIEIPIPDIETQKKYAAIYKSILANQKTYEKSLADLQLICDGYIENLIKTEEPKSLGDYIEQSDEQNTDLKLSLVRGVSIHKKFIETKANMSGVSLKKYKIVRKGQFVFNPNTARMGERIPIALNEEQDCIVSQIYPVFQVSNENILLPEYLFLFFKRPEFDRYTRFHSWGSARETFDWDEMCRVKLPIPDIEIQKSIVTIYHTLETRKRINEKLKKSIKPLCPVLMKGVINSSEKLIKE